MILRRPNEKKKSSFGERKSFILKSKSRKVEKSTKTKWRCHARRGTQSSPSPCSPRSRRYLYSSGRATGGGEELWPVVINFFWEHEIQSVSQSHPFRSERASRVARARTATLALRCAFFSLFASWRRFTASICSSSRTELPAETDIRLRSAPRPRPAGSSLSNRRSRSCCALGVSRCADILEMSRTPVLLCKNQRGGKRWRNFPIPVAASPGPFFFKKKPTPPEK
jgi:hypothetical protein